MTPYLRQLCDVLDQLVHDVPTKWLSRNLQKITRHSSITGQQRRPGTSVQSWPRDDQIIPGKRSTGLLHGRRLP